ncbi:MAG: methyl-accepting chemotaxis protein, partial [Oscillospiraceae bacterium]|nr:methyl-accepting chemotaxis protein [Oscillospiraceae bacterium]
MKNLKVSAKLMAGFAIVVILGVAVGVVGIIGLGDLNTATTEMYDFGLTSVRAMGHLEENFSSQLADIRAAFLSQDDPQVVSSLTATLKESDARAEEYFAIYETTIVDPAQETVYYSARDTYRNSFATAKSGMLEALAQGDFEGAYAIFAEGESVAGDIMDGFERTAEMCDAMTNGLNLASDAKYARLFWVLLAILLVSVIAAAALALYLSGLISKPLGVLSSFMERAGGTGDLTLSRQDMQYIEQYGKIKDEIGMVIRQTASFVTHVTHISAVLESFSNGDLSASIKPLSDKDTLGISLDKMGSSLNRMFGEVNHSTEQVSGGAQQISDGAQALAQGSAEQAATVQNLSASISEVAIKTRENAEMAGRASDMAMEIKDTAEKGSRQMSDMMSAVNEINQASQSISKVIKVIDDIAFQTNILALNAAVEAARAGQQGKGFAVVADEVRNLAAKSAEAARDTAELIANSMEKASLGTSIAQGTAASLADIVEGIGRSSQVIHEIADSSEAQNSSIEQINDGIEQVARVVQQNSATAQQSAAAAQQLNGQSAILSELAKQFKLRENAMAAGSAAGGAFPSEYYAAQSERGFA